MDLVTFSEWDKNQNPYVRYTTNKRPKHRESRMTVLNSDQLKFKRSIKYMKGL